MRVLLTIPPSEFLIDDRAFPFLGPLQIASVALKEGHEVEVCDLTGHTRRCASQEHDGCVLEDARNLLAAHLRRFDPELVGFYSLYAQFPIVTRLRPMVERAKTVIGGPHASTSPDECKRHGFDYVVVSDQGGGGGEPGFLEVLRRAASGNRTSLRLANDGIVQVPSRPAGMGQDRGEYLNDRWPYPARHLIDIPSYHYEVGGRRATTVVSQAGCPFASVGGETVIALPDRVFRICDEKFGPPTFCQDGHGHRISETDSRIVFQGHKQTISIGLSTGAKLILTPNHLVKCAVDEQLRFKKAEDIRIGDWVVIEVGQNNVTRSVALQPPIMPDDARRRVSVSLPATVTPELAWLVGYFLGDGCIPAKGPRNTPSYLVSFSVKPRSEVELRRRIKSVFHMEPHVAYHGHTDKSWQFMLNSRILVEFFRQSLGINGTGTSKLHVPDCIRRSPSCVVREFLAGLWLADGYWPKHRGAKRSYLTTVSESFAEEVAALINWTGDVAVTRAVEGKRLGCNRMYRIEWHDDSCMIPGTRPTCIASCIPTHRRTEKHNGKRRWGGKGGPVHRSHVAEIDPRHELLAPGLRYARVLSVADAGIQATYDAHEHATHTFAANGALVHNCHFCGHLPGGGYQKMVLRSPSHTRGEIEQILFDYPFVGAVMFYDDEVNLRPDFLNFLATVGDIGDYGERLFYRGFFKCGKSFMREDVFAEMKRAGFHTLCTGVEAANPKVLARVGKGATVEDNTRFISLCAEYGINCKLFTMVGHPGETWETVRELRDWLVKAIEIANGRVQIDADVTILTPTRNTPIWDRPDKFPDLIFDRQAMDFGNELIHYKGRPGEYKCVTRTPAMSSGEIIEARQWVEDEFRKAAGLASLAAKDDG